MQSHHYSVFETKGGFCGIAWNGEAANGEAVTRFQLPTDSEAATEGLLLRRIGDGHKAAPSETMRAVIALVQRYFAGERIEFSSVRLDIGSQDEFFKTIYAAARRVGYGHTTTYGTLARELGFGPEKARDVGQAMARNPVALIIPCHRVLAAGGKLGGFSAPGGAMSKQRMLELEGVKLASAEPAQQSLF